MTIFEDLRTTYLKSIFEQIVNFDGDVPNFADKSSKSSISLATSIVRQLGYMNNPTRPTGQTSGKQFQDITKEFLEESFNYLRHIRPGNWEFQIGTPISEFEQYDHLAELSQAFQQLPMLRATLGDYLIMPDIVIARIPETDENINRSSELVEDVRVASLTPLRMINSPKLILHASISCKWTIRSDRSQNARTEGLNLIRNRKGNTPHIVVVTAEPTPQRISSLALGTGDIDCVYHIALYELIQAVQELNNDAVTDSLDILVKGKRLRDISDLPFDLAY